MIKVLCIKNLPPEIIEGKFYNGYREAGNENHIHIFNPNSQNRYIGYFVFKEESNEHYREIRHTYQVRNIPYFEDYFILIEQHRENLINNILDEIPVY